MEFGRARSVSAPELVVAVAALWIGLPGLSACSGLAGCPDGGVRCRPVGGPPAAGGGAGGGSLGQGGGGVGAGGGGGVGAGGGGGVGAGGGGGVGAGGGGGVGAGGGTSCAPEREDAGTWPSGGNGAGGVVYLPGLLQSPVDEALAARWRAIAAAGPGQAGVFAKVGDSITAGGEGVAGSQFLNCFDGTLEGPFSYAFNIHLGRHCALAPTIASFKAPAVGVDGGSWARSSLAAMAGMGSAWATRPAAGGGPSPLDQELAATNPRYAVVMFGSNDIGYFGGGASYPLLAQVEAYETSMRALTDRLLEGGVLPLLSTMPPRWHTPEWVPYVPAFAGVVRAIAQGRQVPLVDYNRALMAVGPPAYGLSSDGVHPSYQGYNTSCFLDDASLATYGYNIRNYLTLWALDRLRQVVETGGPAPDPGALRLQGTGSAADPLRIAAVPFGELRDLRASPERATAPSSCAGAPVILGPRVLYRLELSRATAVRVLVLDRGARALRVSVWAGASADGCLATDTSLIARTLPAGAYTVAVEAAGAGGGSEYNLTVTECVAGDPECP
jgi:hypothetical protein